MGSQKANFEEVEAEWGLLSKDRYSEVFGPCEKMRKEKDTTGWWPEVRLNLRQWPLGGAHTVIKTPRRAFICK